MPKSDPTPPSAPSEGPEHAAGGWPDYWSERAPDAPAVIFDGVELSYCVLAERVARLAGAFRGLGVAPGDRVALLLDNHPAYVESLFACWRLGAISIPVNNRLSPGEIRYILDDATPALVICGAPQRSKLDDAQQRRSQSAARVLFVSETDGDLEAAIEAGDPRTPPHAVSPDDPMILMYTSGTTGAPKGALLPYRKAYFNGLNARHCFDITARDRGLVVAPLFHSLGLQILALPLFQAGACIVLQAGFDAEAVLRDVERWRVTYLGGVPTYYQRIDALLDRAGNEAFDLSSLRFMFTAGAAVSPGLVRRYAERGLLLEQGYGQTETSMLCSLEAENALRKAGSVGRPLPYCELRVVSRDSLDAATSRWVEASCGEVGEIVVRGPITMLGYWNQPQATAETLRDGWVLTGDLATRDEEGFITLVGRSREMFISGGENVYPAEVEAAYVRHPDIHEVAVVGRPDPEWGEVGEAYVVLEAGATFDPAALEAWGREQLAAYKLPRRFHAREALPRTASGKIQKHRLDPR